MKRGIVVDLSQLNPQQQSAVTTTHGPVLLLAGAGSGKTRVIIHRIAYLIDHKLISPKHILAVTFTNKAANEMQERLKAMMGDKQKGLQVSTFHALGVKILRSHIKYLGYRNNFIIYDTQDQLSVIKNIIEENNLDADQTVDPKAVHWAIGQAKNRGLKPDHFLQMKHSESDLLTGKVYQRYQEVLKGCNAIDFDDILNLLLELFEQHSEVMKKIQERYRFIMVDEYQDTNRTQYQLLKHLVKIHRNLCVVGDDDQSIYGWRGADIQNILDFKKDFPEAQIIKLEQNYRSTPVILKAANQVISNNTNRMSKELWSQKNGGTHLEWIQGKTEAEELQQVVDRIRLQVLKYKRSYKDYAILYRSNFQSRLVEESLREASVPYTVVGSTSFYERKEIKDVVAYLRVIHNTDDEVSLHRIINFPRRGIGQTSLMKANSYCQDKKANLFSVMKHASAFEKIPVDAARSMEAFAWLIDKYQKRYETESLHQVTEDLMTEIGLVQAMEKQTGDSKARERKIANVYEFLLSISQYTQKNPEKKLRDFLERLMLFSRNDSEQDDQRNAVTLMTLHSAKGLEFPYVFMVGMADGVFPNQRSLEENGEHEERRLCYVGITRAQQELTFSMAKERKRFSETIRNEPSRFLSEIEEGLFTVAPGKKVNEAVKETKRKQSRSDFFSHLKDLRHTKKMI